MARALEGLVGRDLAVETKYRGRNQNLFEAIADVVQQIARGDEPRLAHAADFRQHDVTRIAADLRLGESGSAVMVRL